MKIPVVYCCPQARFGAEHVIYAKRFASTFLAHPPMSPCDLIVVSNGGPPSAEIQQLFKPLGARFLDHDDKGFDIGAFQYAAKQLPPGMAVFFGGNAYFARSGWLRRMVEAYDRNGPNIYGAFATRAYHTVRDHIRTTGFWMPVELLNAYPREVVTLEQRYQFEHRHTCITGWIESRGKEAFMVTWSGEYRKDQWASVPNAYGNGDHSDCLIRDKISDLVQPVKPALNRKIAIFYHGVLMLGDPPVASERAIGVVNEQMKEAWTSGLLDASSHFVVGLNGGHESETLVKWPLSASPGESKTKKAVIIHHGMDSLNENLTMAEIEKWIPGHEDWYVFYFHAKGASKDGPTRDFNGRWRRCMMGHTVTNWKQCIADLDAGADSVGCHWMPGMAEGGVQNIWAGNFWWAKASYLATLPSIHDRQQIKQTGIRSVEARYESEVWIGNGPRLPIIKDYHPEGFRTCP